MTISSVDRTVTCVYGHVNVVPSNANVNNIFEDNDRVAQLLSKFCRPIDISRNLKLEDVTLDSYGTCSCLM